MAKYLSNIDLNKNQLQNPVIHSLGTAPTTPVEGQIYFDSTAGDKHIYLYNGTAWVQLSEGAHTSDSYVSNVSLSGTDLTFTGVGSAFSGTVDLSSLDEIVNNSTITIAAGDYLSTGGSFTLNQATNATITINHDATTRADTTSSDSPAFGGTFTAVQSVTTNATGHVTAIDVSTVTLPTPAASDNYQYWTLSDGTNSTNIGSTDTATFQGTSGEIGVTESSGTVTIGLRDNVTIPNNLTVTNTLDMTNGQINNLANGTASTDAVNLGQVQGLIAGTGQFQGGYDATNDPGSPAISGSSNIALDTGDFYVVTVDGEITFSDQTISVEVGDLIFANTDITANSNPASTDYTFVIQDQNIAGEGATDSATEKGVAGFNSAHFSVTSNGFVSADIYGGGSTLGIVPSGGSGTTFLRGDGTWVTPTGTTPNDATITLSAGTNLTGGGDFTTDQATNETITFNLATANASTIGAGNVAAGTGISVSYSSGTATITNTDTNTSNTDTGTITAGSTSGTVTHNFGTTNVIVQTYLDNATDNYPTVFCDVTRASNSVTATIASAETDDIIILVQKIG